MTDLYVERVQVVSGCEDRYQLLHASIMRDISRDETPALLTQGLHRPLLFARFDRFAGKKVEKIWQMNNSDART